MPRKWLTAEENHISKIWTNMNARCYNKKSSSYPDYGGRGITVQFLSVEHFVEWSLANGYQKGLEIDRIYNDGPYAPWNCQWSTRKTQARNRRSTKWLFVNGQRMSLAEAVEKYGPNLPYVTIAKRMLKGYTFEEALSLGVKTIEVQGEVLRISEAVNRYGKVSLRTVADRLSKGWDTWEALTKPSRKKMKSVDK